MSNAEVVDNCFFLNQQFITRSSTAERGNIVTYIQMETTCRKENEEKEKKSYEKKKK